MANSRFIAAFLAALALCALMTIVKARQDAEAARGGHDTFGMNYYGWRGVYDAMGRLGLPVARGKAPPAASAPRDQTLIFWEPSRDIAAATPAHVEALRRWVEAGGHAVVAPARGESMVAAAMAAARAPGSAEAESGPEFLLTALVGDRAGVALREPPGAPRRPRASDRPRQKGKPNAFADNVDAYVHLVDNFRSPRDYALRGTGRFRAVAEAVPAARLPHNLQTLTLPRPPAAVLYALDGEERLPLAADFAVGRGRVTAVGDPTLLCNAYLRAPGNAALALALIREPGKTTCFDEFFHGHAARGGALGPFLAPPYSLPLAALGVLLALAAWKHGTAFGPPLAPEGAPRRSVREHIAALTLLLQRGRAQRFVLRGLLNGALWQCRHRDGGGMAAGAADIDAVAARIAHREPGRAARFAAAARRCEELAAAPEPPGARQALAAAKGLLREVFPAPNANAASVAPAREARHD